MVSPICSFTQHLEFCRCASLPLLNNLLPRPWSAVLLSCSSKRRTLAFGCPCCSLNSSSLIIPSQRRGDQKCTQSQLRDSWIHMTFSAPFLIISDIRFALANVFICCKPRSWPSVVVVSQGPLFYTSIWGNFFFPLMCTPLHNLNFTSCLFTQSLNHFSRTLTICFACPPIRIISLIAHILFQIIFNNNFQIQQYWSNAV